MPWKKLFYLGPVLGIAVLSTINAKIIKKQQIADGSSSLMTKNLSSEHAEVSKDVPASDYNQVSEGTIDTIDGGFDKSRDSEKQKESWYIERFRIYSLMNLMRSDLDEIDRLNTECENHVEMLYQRYETSAKYLKDDIAMLIKKQIKRYDVSVQKIVGEERFEVVMKARDQVSAFPGEVALVSLCP